MAGCWALMGTPYKQIAQRYFAPISLKLQTDLGVVGKSRKGIAIQAKISVKNHGQRRAYLLKPFYIALGKKFEKLEPEPRLSEPISNYRAFQPEEKIELVAFDCPFWDEQIEPQEEKDVKVLFFIPKNRYDYIEFNVLLPINDSKENITLEWDFRDKKALPIFKMKGEEIPVSEVENFTKKYGIKNFDSITTLSLWPSSEEKSD